MFLAPTGIRQISLSGRSRLSTANLTRDHDRKIGRIRPPPVLKHVTRIAIEMHHSKRKQDGAHQEATSY